MRALHSQHCGWFRFRSNRRWKKRSAVVPAVARSNYSAGVLSPRELWGR
jgi:hypothetical protein